MKATILCSSINHPINPWLKKWITINSYAHDISLVRNKRELKNGDILFLVSCHEIVTKKDRDNFKATLVLHASDLPNGRGWNPHIWEIINGKEIITVTLLEAEDYVDSGKIWKKININITSDALYDEINDKLFATELKLMSFALENFGHITPTEQSKETNNNHYRLRNPDDSRIDPKKTIEEQFNLIRVCDPNRFPAFFKLNGHTYKLKVEKDNETNNQD